MKHQRRETAEGDATTSATKQLGESKTPGKQRETAPAAREPKQDAREDSAESTGGWVHECYRFT